MSEKNMIMGVGVDIVEISRISAMDEAKKSAFAKKVLSSDEYALWAVNPTDAYIASRFAAKESISKALGTGFFGFGFTDITISHDEYGRPFVVGTKRFAAAAQNRGIGMFQISISHEKNNAVAFCVATS